MRTATAAILALMLTAGSAAEAGDTTRAGLDAYSGRVTYVDFWASWCTPCAESFPWLNEMQAKYAGQLAVVGVNVDTDAKDAKAFLQRHRAAFDVLYDPAGALAERFRITGMPSAVIIDRDGRVVHQHAGFRTSERAEYEAAIQKALQAQETR